MTAFSVRNWADSAASDPGQAWRLVQHELHCQGLGNAYFIFDYPLFSTGFPSEDQMMGTVISQEWKQACRMEGGDIGWVNPGIVPLAASSGRKVVYDIADLIKHPGASRLEAKTLTIALDCGAKIGYSLPVVDRIRRSFSLMIVDGVDSADDYAELMQRHESALWQGVIYLHEGMTVRRLIKEAGKNPLSPREQDCLAWTAAGRSAKQIADTLQLADSTVNEYLRSACRKLGATNKTQAAARATLLHFVEP